MTQQKLLELAKQGNEQAITVLLNRALQPQGISARVVIKNSCLHLLLESTQVPDQQTLVPAIYRALANLKSSSFKTLILYGRLEGQQQAIWSETIEMPPLEEAGVYNGIQFSSPYFQSSLSGDLSDDNGSPDLFNEIHPDFSETEPPDLEEVSIPDLELPLLETGTTREMQLEAVPVDEAGEDGATSTTSSRSSSRFSWLRNLLLGSMTFLILAVLGLNLMFAAKRKDALDQSQKLIDAAGEARTAPNLKALQGARQPLEEAMRLLETAPQFPGFPDSKVAEQLAGAKTRLEGVDNRLRVEKQALISLKTAEQFAADAQELRQQAATNPVLNAQVRTKYQQAVALLRTIPKGTYVSAESQVKLASYRAALVSLNRSVTRPQTPASTTRTQTILRRSTTTTPRPTVTPKPSVTPKTPTPGTKS